MTIDADIPGAGDDGDPADGGPTSAQVATVLAALRFYQRGLIEGTVPPEILNIASDDGIEEPLTAEEIDELCEQVNG